MLIGSIAKIISEKGIGFIKPSGAGRDVFFHCSVVPDEQFEQLAEGQAVSYELDRDREPGDRPRASLVKPCDQKLLGQTGAPESAPPQHPRARRRKPTWRR
jgi:CspA family cold shock protein